MSRKTFENYLERHEITSPAFEMAIGARLRIIFPLVRLKGCAYE